jgi:hypothetical protein
MSLACREYIATEVIGDRTASVKMMVELNERLTDLARRKLIRGSLVKLLQSADDIEQENLDEEEVFAITGEIFPAVWVNVTYDTDVLDVDDLSDIEKHFGLSLLTEFVSDMNF